MQLIFQNSKDNKQARQFIKSLKYVFNSMIQKQKNVFLYISTEYIAVVSNFLDKQAPNYRVCFCKFKKHMYKLKNFFNGMSQQQQKQGLIYKIDVSKMVNMLNSQIQSMITQLTLTFPNAESPRQNIMMLSYISQQLKLSSKIYITKQQSPWPFKQGQIDQQFISNSFVVNFMLFPSTFIDQISYAKKFSNFWLILGINQINIKQAFNGYVSFDHKMDKKQFGDYDYINIKQSLKDKIFFNIRRDMFFHHLSFAKKQNKKTNAKLIVQQQVYGEQRYIKKCYIYLTTISERTQIHEMFEISANESINLNTGGGNNITNPQRFKLQLTAKKQENIENQDITLNRFYAPQYRDLIHFNQLKMDGIVKNLEHHEEQVLDPNPRRYKAQF